MKGFEHANALALDLWEDVYPDDLHLALTDTYSTEAFYKVRLRRRLLPSYPRPLRIPILRHSPY